MWNEIGALLVPILAQGLIYSLVVMGVFISSRLLQFDDLTTEGSFGIGGALTALLIVSGISPWVSMPLAMMSGAMAGGITGVLHTKMKVNPLISGLVVTTALFSVCLALAHSHRTLPEGLTIFSSCWEGTSSVLLLCLLVCVIFWGVWVVLDSEIGLLLKALGSNAHMVTSIGKNVESYKIGGLALSNGLTALSGSLFVQWTGLFSITANVGTLVIGLASLILSEMVKSSFGFHLIGGAVLYQALFALTIELGLDPMWNNLIKALLIVFLIQWKPQREIIRER